jgi:peptidyl-prolyl cis-trans isomerase SurA
MKTALTSLFAGLLALCAFAAPVPAAAQSTAPVDGIVAIVDEDVILRSELDRAVNNIVAQYASQPGQLPPRDVLERQVLDRLILMRLQLVRATESGIRVSDGELEQAVASVAQRNGLAPDQLRQRLAADGIAYEEFRNSLREEMMLERMRQRFVQSRVQVSEAEIDQALASTVVGGPEVHLRNLLIALPDGATPEQVATAKQKIDGIHGLISRGELDFTAAAIRYSDAQNALDGGDIGWRTLDTIPPVFASMLQSMQPGQVSEPVRGPNGYQIVQLVETRQAGPQTVEEYSAQGLLIRITPTRPSEVARQKAEELRARIAAGEDFAAIARAESEDTMSKGAGGDMGWFPVGAWGTAVASQLQMLKDGELSQAFQSEVGWHVIRRVGVRQSDVTEKNRRNQAREQIIARKAEDEYERFLRQMRAEAFVDSRLPAPGAASTP